MKTGCIEHPAQTHFLILREEYLEICADDHCAAGILHIFEQWHDTKLNNAVQARTDKRISEAGGIVPEQSESLWVYMTYDELRDSLFGLFGINKIGIAVRMLVERGFLYQRTNPRAHWDKTPQYLFIPESVQQAIDLSDLVLTLRGFKKGSAIPQTPTQTGKTEDSNDSSSRSALEGSSVVPNTNTKDSLPAQKSDEPPITPPRRNDGAGVAGDPPLSADPVPDAETSLVKTITSLGAWEAAIGQAFKTNKSGPTFWKWYHFLRCTTDVKKAHTAWYKNMPTELGRAVTPVLLLGFESWYKHNYTRAHAEHGIPKTLETVTTRLEEFVSSTEFDRGMDVGYERLLKLMNLVQPDTDTEANHGSAETTAELIEWETKMFGHKLDFEDGKTHD